VHRLLLVFIFLPYEPKKRKMKNGLILVYCYLIAFLFGMYQCVQNKVRYPNNIEDFISANDSTINEPLKRAMLMTEEIDFEANTYLIDTITIRPTDLKNPKRLVLNFDHTVLKTKDGCGQVKIIGFENIETLEINGTLTIDGNVVNNNIINPMKHQGEAFLDILAPFNNSLSLLKIGSITVVNMPVCGVNIRTDNAPKTNGYDLIKIQAIKEINGYNGLNMQIDGWAIWCFRVLGAHRSIVIDTLYANQGREPWGDMAFEKSLYTFTFENQIDPESYTRKDLLHIKNLIGVRLCSMLLYTQAVNHVLIDNYSIDSTLTKPNLPDSLVYPTMLKENLSWIGSKHTWTSYKCEDCSFEIKNTTIKNTNSAFMGKAINDITGFWLNKGMSGAMFGTIDTDIRVKLYGDGYYFGIDSVPDGHHHINKFVCQIPNKRNYVQPFNGDIVIDTLVLAERSGVIIRKSNALIGYLNRKIGSNASFE
jgi:hypothetical protein